jgi:phosphotransacetylase
LDIVEASMAAVRDRALKVVLPEGEDERILRSAQQLSARRLAHPVVLGVPAEVAARAASLGLSLDGC